jgi:hypothetical protein
VLINAVLNSIPIFFLSFLKMPVGVWKKVVKIQRQFLWGGVRGGNKICWIKWSVVCKDKCQGGLGVRDVRLVNISLLSKWRWRLLQPGMPLWKEVIVAKYGNHGVQFVDWSNSRIQSLLQIGGRMCVFWKGPLTQKIGWWILLCGKWEMVVPHFLAINLDW